MSFIRFNNLLFIQTMNRIKYFVCIYLTTFDQSILDFDPPPYSHLITKVILPQ
uniref:Uncharacterized protein n=1 Tax=Solanum lycopersicum TaxID=4081 RepID=A0A3Q7GTU5_SOLLC